MEWITGGDLVVRCLVNQGVDTVFAVSGGQMGTIFDAIARNPHIRLITPRNEVSSPLMACGYMAASGTPAVCMSTVGAGVVYEVAGLARAWFGCLPLVSIAPQVQSWKMKPHQENLQACEQDELFQPVTKWNTIVYNWERIPQMIDRGFREALTGIPGPVHLDFPVDILFRRRLLSESKKEALIRPTATTRHAGIIAGDPESIRNAASRVAASKKPLALAGQGYGRMNRGRNIVGELKRMGVPVITSRLSSGILRGSDDVYAGEAILFTETEPGRAMLMEADLILILGADPEIIRLVDIAHSDGATPTVVQIEEDPAAFLTRQKNLTPVHASPTHVLQAVATACVEARTDFAAWRKECRDAGDKASKSMAATLSDSWGFLRELSPQLTDNDIVLADGAEAMRAAACYLRNAAYRDLLLLDPREFAGAGLPMAMGACLGTPHLRVLLITDKDSLFRHIRELQPALALNLNLKIIVSDQPADEFNVADTASVLEGFGWEVKRIKTISAFSSDGPVFDGSGPGAVVVDPSTGA